jgi:hypothetical protein
MRRSSLFRRAGMDFEQMKKAAREKSFRAVPIGNAASRRG